MSDILVSIVTGTYNRLPHLKRMVESVRQSICYGLSYEIVLVDGGSTDGTQDWADSQDDVVLIEQGELLGAVKAFNAGAYEARGYYVILANDDIEFIGLSITNAISYMEDNLKVGIGCFYQDRGGNDWHVDTMPAIIDGKQGRAYYGQVCIIPKYLGFEVGWWGDYLRTYGGDNEMSANVLALGYSIEPMPCCRIHDVTVQDELRELNTRQQQDSAKWYAKWTRSNGLIGPRLGKSIYPLRDARKRIFYAPIYEPGHPIQYKTKHGLRDALKTKGLLVECDYIKQGMGVLLDWACAIDPHLILTQFQDYKREYVEAIAELRTNHPEAKLVNWNGDYHPDTLFNSNYVSMMRMFDYAGFAMNYEVSGVNSFYWQIGWEPWSEDLPKVPKYDILFLGNGYSKQRLELADTIRSVPGAKVGLYGHWPESYNSAGYNVYDFDQGTALYRAAKIAIGDSQWPQIMGYVSNRLFQAMAAGAFFMQQEFCGMQEYLGLIPDVHLVTWTTFDDLWDKLVYWLNPLRNAARHRIAGAGYRYILENHSFANRVDELMKLLYDD